MPAWRAQATAAPLRLQPRPRPRNGTQLEPGACSSAAGRRRNSRCCCCRRHRRRWQAVLPLPEAPPAKHRVAGGAARAAGRLSFAMRWLALLRARRIRTALARGPGLVGACSSRRVSCASTKALAARTQRQPAPVRRPGAPAAASACRAAGHCSATGQATLAWAPNSPRRTGAGARRRRPGELARRPARTAEPRCWIALPMAVLLRDCRGTAGAARRPGLSQPRRSAPPAAPGAGAALRHSRCCSSSLDLAYGQRQRKRIDWCEAPSRFEARRELAWRSDNAMALLQEAEPLAAAPPACGWLPAMPAAHSIQSALAARRDARPRHRPRWRTGAGKQPGASPICAVGSACSPNICSACRCRRRSASCSCCIEQFRGPCQKAKRQPAGRRRRDRRPPCRGREPGRAAHAAVGATRSRGRCARCRPKADHRPEHQQRWQAWQAGAQVSAAGRAAARGRRRLWPQPSWLLEPAAAPGRLARAAALPGPADPAGRPAARRERLVGRQPPASRDYYLAHSRQAGLLWLYRERSTGEQRLVLAGAVRMSLLVLCVRACQGYPPPRAATKSTNLDRPRQSLSAFCACVLGTPMPSRCRRPGTCRSSA